MSSSRECVEAAFADLDAAFEALAALSYDVLTTTEKSYLLGRLETHRRRQPAIEHRLLNELAAECRPEALGATSLPDVLATRLRISRKEANRRIAEAADLGPRTALTGEPLEPVLPATARAQADGLIGAEHVTVIARFFRRLPHAVDVGTRADADAQLAQIGAQLGPAELGQAADRLAYLLDQDGPAPSDAERARRRYLTVGRQQSDGMSEVRGRLDPEGRAIWEAVAAKWAAPGRCNPDDERPCVDEQPAPARAEADLRSQSQRNHDAFKALGRSALASGRLGQHKGLPATIIVSTTLSELEAAAGHAVTAGGSLLPMSEVIRLAAHAYHYLAIFTDHTREALYLGRTKRIASAAQRIVLHARDRGCTFPGCTAPGYRCEAHHAKKGWAAGGQTNVDDEVLACPPHNRLIEKGHWSTRIRKDGRVEWIPPPHLDTGQARVNNYHHPQNYLLPDANDE